MTLTHVYIGLDYFFLYLSIVFTISIRLGVIKNCKCDSKQKQNNLIKQKKNYDYELRSVPDVTYCLYKYFIKSTEFNEKKDFADNMLQTSRLR